MSKKNTIAKIGHAIVSFDGAGIGHLLTVQEAAGVLRCSVSSLNKWRLTGSGPPFVRVGSRVRYRTSDLNTYIAGRTVTSTSEKSRRPRRRRPFLSCRRAGEASLKRIFRIGATGVVSSESMNP